MSYLGNPLSSQNFPVDYFTGNGTQTNFTLSQTPASATAIQVYVGGVKQLSSIVNPSYFVAGNILVLSAAPANGTPIEVNYLGLLSQVNVPANQSITSSMLSLQVANAFLYQTTTTGSSNTFTLNAPPISANAVVVTANGITQYDYSINGSVLTLNYMPPANQLLRVQSLALAQAGVPSDGSVTSTKMAPGAISSNTILASAVVTSDKIVSVANTQITGNIISSQITSVANTQVTGLVTSSQLAPTAQFVGMKNRIINGAMVVDQRNSGSAVSNANGYVLDRYTFDRLGAYSASSSSVQRSSTAPAGFNYSACYTVTTGGASPGATEGYRMVQTIEGYNLADMAQGTANAQTFTLSFWVRSSVTGNYGVAFRNSAGDRSYVASYTINSANTFEYKTITVPGCTNGGTWNYTNGAGMDVLWDLGVGSNYQTTPGSWASGNYYALPGGVKISTISGATWYITGVQLEVGSSATSFDYRPYGTELALCQRYTQALEANAFGIYLSSANCGTTWAWWPIKATFRSAPSLTLQNSGAWSGTTPTIYSQPNQVGFYGGTTNFYLGGGSSGNVVAILSAEL